MLSNRICEVQAQPVAAGRGCWRICAGTLGRSRSSWKTQRNGCKMSPSVCKTANGVNSTIPYCQQGHKAQLSLFSREKKKTHFHADHIEFGRLRKYDFRWICKKENKIKLCLCEAEACPSCLHRPFTRKNRWRFIIIRSLLLWGWYLSEYSATCLVQRSGLWCHRGEWRGARPCLGSSPTHTQEHESGLWAVPSGCS